MPETVQTQNHAHFERAVIALRACRDFLADANAEALSGLTAQERMAARWLMELCEQLPAKHAHHFSGKRTTAKKPSATLTNPQRQTVADLRADGFAVTIFNPKELKGATPSRVEDRLVELGWEVIDCLKD